MAGLIDDFNRANESPLSSGYGIGFSGGIDLNLVSSQVQGVNASFLSDVTYNTVFGADQTSQVTVPVLPGSAGRFIRLYVRVSAQATNANGYMIQWEVAGSHLRMFRMDSGTPTQLASNGGSMTAGDVIAFVAVGTVLTVYQNGTSVLSYDTSADTTKYTGSGRLGLGTGDNTARLDDFSGGTQDVTATVLSTGAVFAATVIASSSNVAVPFVHASTIYPLFSVYGDAVGTGPGNGGELFTVELAPAATSVTATLAADLTATGSLLELTGDSGLPDTFCLTINSETLYVAKIAAGSYRIRRRAMSNTTAASHSAGASAAWTDTYDMAIGATDNADASFTANILSTGSFTYYGWAIAFDSSQGYLSGSRYPAHISSVLGVFPSGGTSNKLDSAQPNAVCVPGTISDNCPAALAVPARISGNIVPGDVALVRYRNTEASILTLGSRSCSVQTWYGMKRVSSTDADVTLTNTAGTIVDGSVEGTWFNPVTTGINPSTGGAVSSAFYTSVTLPGSSRTFTHTGSPPNYSDHGWPIGNIAVRQGTRRVPFGASYDWHNFSYVYTGFADDATYAQMVINRNGVTNPSSPAYALPGTQDISGPDALWDDNTYHFGAAWYVAVFNAPFLLIGPTIGGVGGGTAGPVSSVSFPVSGGGGTASFPAPVVEGGSWGGINPPGAAASSGRLQASIF